VRKDEAPRIGAPRYMTMLVGGRGPPRRKCPVPLGSRSGARGLGRRERGEFPLNQLHHLREPLLRLTGALLGDVGALIRDPDPLVGGGDLAPGTIREGLQPSLQIIRTLFGRAQGAGAGCAFAAAPSAREDWMTRAKLCRLGLSARGATAEASFW
jgi:hypothetical protein